VKHLVYASSSSVYGLNTDTPYQEQHSIAHPVSLYAATKKADELMAHAYSHLYNLPTTGLRFFTVYGPWGRPDMSPALFADAIFHDSPIKVFNNGDMFRDFTYVDDIVEGVIRVVDKPAQPDANWSSQNPNPATSSAPYRIYNIGNSAPVKLMDFIRSIEVAIGKDAEKIMMPMQSGDVVGTYADTSLLQNNIDFKPSTPLASGMKKYIDWYKKYYKL
jgi:UDP-glucuronate 4-epimerase